MILESPAFKSQRELNQQRRVITEEGGKVEESGIMENDGKEIQGGSV